MEPKLLLHERASTLLHILLAGDTVPQGEIERIEQGAKLFEVTEKTAEKKRPARLLPITIFAALAILSIFVSMRRVSRPRLELQANVKGLQFRTAQTKETAQAQKLTDAIVARQIDCSGVQELEYPAVASTSVEPYKTNETLSLKAQDGAPTTTITIDPIAVATGTVIEIYRLPDSRIQLHLAKRPNEIKFSVRGPIAVTPLGPADPARIQSATPKSIVARGNDLILEIDPISDMTSLLSHSVKIDSISFVEMDEYAEQNVKIQQPTSTLLKGELRFVDIAGTDRKLHHQEELRFDGVRGDLESVGFNEKERAIEIDLHGMVRHAESGRGDELNDLRPTLLSWALARHTAAVAWSTLLSVFGLVIAVVRWFGGNA